MFKKRVDLVTEKALHPLLKNKILKELVTIMKTNKQRDEFYIKSIRDEIHKIEIFVKGETHTSFSKNEQKQYAVYKACENIGEAVKHLSKN